MTSDKPPLVLMHGLAMSGRAWQDVVPLLVDFHDVHTPTALGHRGGPAVQKRPVKIWDVIDDAERYLDDHQLERPHLAGNSMGGMVAIELARRGRAATVCALSPGGFWSAGDGLRATATGNINRGATMVRRTHHLARLMMKSATMRRISLQSATPHGDRVSTAQAIEMLEDTIGCTITAEVQSGDDEQVDGLDPLPCPVTLAWSGRDTVLPLASYEKVARNRLPQATFTVLPNVGHVPMLDDPGLVARTILATTGATIG
jgi:pimeloyl-ACP methyl ester carboxylesterase